MSAGLVVCTGHGQWHVLPDALFEFLSPPGLNVYSSLRLGKRLPMHLTKKRRAAGRGGFGHCVCYFGGR
jgi:hypothetical protein